MSDKITDEEIVECRRVVAEYEAAVNNVDEPLVYEEKKLYVARWARRNLPRLLDAYGAQREEIERLWGEYDAFRAAYSAMGAEGCLVHMKCPNEPTRYGCVDCWIEELAVQALERTKGGE